jgi:hypothetical protein
MNIESKLILASKSEATGITLYTFVLTYPRVILAEVNTHRMLSRNTASSRAIPAKKQRERVLTDPFVPVTIGANQKGMQAGEELDGWRRFVAINTWKLARYPMVAASWVLDKVGAHKQVVNRIVEPWTFTQQVVTCTDLKNVFKLRNHKDAEPHFQIIAKQMQMQAEWAEKWFNTLSWNSENALDRRLEINNQLGVGTLQVLKPGEWHMPFVDEKDITDTILNSMLHDSTDESLKKISTARCARVSYFLPESGKRSDPKRDVELCNKLSGSGHWSPFEHVATPTKEADYIGNFKGWKQYRKEYPQESGGDRGN